LIAKEVFSLDTGNVLLAFGLTIFAGLSTGIGSLFILFVKKPNGKFLSIVLGFSAGVMIYVSFVEIFAEAKSILIGHYGNSTGLWVTTAAFFAGMFLIAVIDKLIPSYENPHESHNVENMERCLIKSENINKLMRTGFLTALAIAVHNFPEGIAAFASALKTPSLGIAIAIAIHNIPEGISVSVPVYCATGDRKKAFIYSFLSGLAEPLGALIGYGVLMPIMSDVVFGVLFAAVAGIMVFISLDELLPTAREYGEHHLSIFGMVLGMMVMAASLILFI